jgi:hypothetical protein
MAAFLHSKGQILWDFMVNTAYVHSMNFLAPGSRDMFDANNKMVDYLYRSLCESEFERVWTEGLACRVWEQLKNAHVGNAQVQVRVFVTYRREYENFTHLPGDSIDAMFQRFTVIVKNMRANVVVLPYDDHDRAVKLLHSLDRTMWSGKVEAILDSRKYETLTVDELFSKLKSSEVDRGVRAKIENPTDPHSLALVSGSRTNANMSLRQFSLSFLVSMPDEEFDVLGEEAVRAHVHESEECSEELGHVLPVREARALHRRVPRSHGGQARAQAPFDDRPQAPLEGQLQGQEQFQAEAELEWWSQEEGASDGGRCERHRLKLLLLFIVLK